jgi:hypothetical protein
MEITINVPDVMARDLAFAMNFSKANEELILRVLTRFYADMFNPLTGQQIKD